MRRTKRIKRNTVKNENGTTKNNNPVEIIAQRSRLPRARSDVPFRARTMCGSRKSRQVKIAAAGTNTKNSWSITARELRLKKVWARLKDEIPATRAARSIRAGLFFCEFMRELGMTVRLLFVSV